LKRSDHEIDQAIDSVISNPDASFVQLVKLAGLDPRRSFRFANLENVNLSGEDLSGYDFTGADLRLANLEGANLKGAVLTHALLPSSIGDTPKLISTFEKMRGAFMEARYAVGSQTRLGASDLETLMKCAPDFRTAVAAAFLSYQHGNYVPPLLVRQLLERIPRREILGAIVRALYALEVKVGGDFREDTQHIERLLELLDQTLASRFPENKQEHHDRLLRYLAGPTDVGVGRMTTAMSLYLEVLPQLNAPGKPSLDYSSRIMAKWFIGLENKMSLAATIAQGRLKDAAENYLEFAKRVKGTEILPFRIPGPL
jgi:hypothetical protein